MKKIYSILIILCAQLSVAQTVNSYGDLTPTITGESVFLDASAYSGVGDNLARGLVFPRTSLATFTFVSEGSSFGNFATGYDGMVIYNTVAGTTPALGSGIGGQLVAPGFYYFSNPDSSGDTVTGRWLPLGGSSTKSKTVTADADGVSATLPLTTLDDSDLVTFLGAKIYDAAGKLVMTADSEYNAATNVLNTGNGFMYQALAAGTYTVIVDYK